MVNFERIEKMIDFINNGKMPENIDNNDFFISFYLETKALPLSKYLRMKNFSNKMPKIMNAKKAGEILYETKKNPEILDYIKKRGYEDIPQLTFTCIMLFRKIDLKTNWEKVLDYLEGKGTIEKINVQTRKKSFPEERKKIELELMESLNINYGELEWLINKYKSIDTDIKLKRLFKKLII